MSLDRALRDLQQPDHLRTAELLLGQLDRVHTGQHPTQPAPEHVSEPLPAWGLVVVADEVAAGAESDQCRVAVAHVALLDRVAAGPGQRTLQCLARLSPF